MVVKRKQIKRKVRRPQPKRRQQKSWINSSLSLNNKSVIKRRDVFNTGPKTKLSNMFKDFDRDGVANAFDCKPYNKNKQGLLDAIVAVAKGGGRAGWKEGMSKEKKRLVKMPDDKRKAVDSITLTEWKKRKKIAEEEKRQKAIFDNAKKGMRGKYKNVRTLKEIERINSVRSGISKIKNTPAKTKKYLQKHNTHNPKSFGGKLALSITRANPKYNMKYEKKPLGMTNKEWRAEQQNYIIRRTARRQLIGGGASTKANTLSRSIGMVFPQAKGRTASGGAVGAPGQRGRPRGSYEGKYAAYGGVFGYRKAMALKKKAAKFAQQQAELQAKISGQPQYETQQYQEVPQEMEGATPEYSQFNEMQKQAEQGQEVIYEDAQPQQPQMERYQQQPQGYTQPQRRPVATVFKSSGGSPYPAVQGSLAPTNANPDYVEVADAFTGERKWVKKQQAESWSKPKMENEEPIIKQSWMGNR